MPTANLRALDIGRHEFVNFRFDSGAHFTVRYAADGLTKRANVASVNLVECKIRGADV